MAIEVVPPETEANEDEFTEEGSEYNFRDLMDNLYKERDLIFTIPKDQEPMLRQGLIIRKAKDNAKVKGASLKPDGDVLSFLAYPAKEKDGTDSLVNIDIRVKLAPKKSVTILDMRVPSNDY